MKKRAAKTIDYLADKLRREAKQTGTKLVTMGKWLAQAKKEAGRSEWPLWLNRQLGWHPRQAQRLINVYKRSESDPNYDALSNLPPAVLNMLTASAPPQAEGDHRVVASDKVPAIVESQNPQHPINPTSPREETPPGAVRIVSISIQRESIAEYERRISEMRPKAP